MSNPILCVPNLYPPYVTSPEGCQRHSYVFGRLFRESTTWPIQTSVVATRAINLRILHRCLVHRIQMASLVGSPTISDAHTALTLQVLVTVLRFVLLQYRQSVNPKYVYQMLNSFKDSLCSVIIHVSKMSIRINFYDDLVAWS
jgi:hypothetical protein